MNQISSYGHPHDFILHLASLLYLIPTCWLFYIYLIPSDDSPPFEQFFSHFWFSECPLIMYRFKIWLRLVNGPRFAFLDPPRPNFGRFVFAFLVFWESTDYVYKIWLSLVQGPRFSFFDLPPQMIINDLIKYQKILRGQAYGKIMWMATSVY